MFELGVNGCKNGFTWVTYVEEREITFLIVS